MNNRLFAGILLALASFIIVGCSSDNVMQDASQVTNLNEVDLSVFEKSIEDMPSRANDASGTPLSKTNLFSELEVAMIPASDSDSLCYVARQLSKDEGTFGEVKLYVPDGDYYLVAVAANTQNPGKDHQITIKSTAEVKFPDNKVTDMAYCYKKVTIVNKKTTLSEPLHRGVACFHLTGTDVRPDSITKFAMTFSKGGKTFNPSTGCCYKEEPIDTVYNISSDKFKGNKLNVKLFTLLTKLDESDAVVTFKAIDKNGKVIKDRTFNNVHMVQGKRTHYTGPIFTFATGSSFTIDHSEMEDVDSGHTFE